MTKKSIIALSLLFAPLGIIAQTTADFELTLPSQDTSYLETLSIDGSYPFTVGNISLVGKVDYGGTYFTGFNYSNRQNDSVGNWLNSWSAITASGYNSNTYGIVYLESDYNDFFKSQINTIKLVNNAIGNYVMGTYLTNSTWAYKWIEENYATGDYIDLVFKGYHNGVVGTDSVVVSLADYRSTSLDIIKEWTWVDLTPLKQVDSLTIQMFTSNSFTPMYLAFDDFITSDGVCPNATNVTASGIDENSATITWNNNASHFAIEYDIAIDTSNTNEPHANTTIQTLSDTFFVVNGLAPNTAYTAHIRTKCDGDTTNWQKINFSTKALGIASTTSLMASIYPNPASQILKATVANERIASIRVYSLQGQMLKQENNTNQISLQQLASGNYIVEIITQTNKAYRDIFTKL